MRRTKEAATQAACAGNTRGYHSEYGNLWFNNRENDDAYYMLRSCNNCYYYSIEPVSDKSNNYKVIYTENDDAYCMFWSYNNCYYSSSESVIDEEDEL